MTTLYEANIPVWCVDLNGESTLPSLHDIKLPEEPRDFEASEDDGLWINYEAVRTCFPYKMQDCYSRDLVTDSLPAVILENEHLRATFVPKLGGKMWSLFDKDAKKELLFSNHVFRTASLALRNAWASGGVEWNCGAFTGHHPHTCEPLFTAVMDKEKSGLGCPVLRMYTYERIRSVTYQMDFYLPENARFLHCRMRVVNDNYERTDMYWWSNIAVPSNTHARDIVPADYAFTVKNNSVVRVSVPRVDGIDVTYSTNNPIAVDYFFKCRENERPYTAYLDENGYGLCETSTALLKGRKLFTWGQGQGGTQWQEYLSGDDGHGRYQDGKYCEIQCGLATSQYECLPMPPKTAWEWMEYYGPMSVNPQNVHGEWSEAQKTVASALDSLLPADATESELKATRLMATAPADKLLLTGLGWGALENKRREKVGMKPLCPHLDFGECKEEQEMWVKLLETGSLATDGNKDAAIAPISYQRGNNWEKHLRAAAEKADCNYWLTHYMLGCAYLSECKLEDAEKELSVSLHLSQNALNTYAMAEYHRVSGDSEKYLDGLLLAAKTAPDDISLCKITAQALCDAGKWDALAAYIDGFDDIKKSQPCIRFNRAIAAVNRNEIDLAENLLNENGGLQIPDIREGEYGITELWFDIEEKKAQRDGIAFDRATAKVPQKFDFRMF